MLRAVSLLLLVGSLATALSGQVANSVVIVYAEFGNQYEIGTGSFVDHDGLIITADHVVHHIALSPPSSFLASNPPVTNPTKIKVYSKALRAVFDVDLSTVVGGNISQSQWIDVAFLRVALSNVQKAAIAPLDISMDVPNQGETVTAYGPLCTQYPIVEDCFQPAVQQTDLFNDPRTAREYQVRSNITAGFSGGPLVNSSGKILAITSWGDITESGAVVKASFVPAPYILHYFSGREPISNAFAEAVACDTANSLGSLTFLDWDQISRPWHNASLTAGQCTCYCSCLTKRGSFTVTPQAADSCSAAPPFCAAGSLYGVVAAVKLGVITGSLDPNTYNRLNNAFKVLNLAKFDISDRKKILDAYGSTLYLVASNPKTRDLAAFNDASSLALQAYGKRLAISEDAPTYAALSKIFGEVNDSKASVAATILYEFNDKSLSAIDKKSLHIDEKPLKQVVNKGIADHAPI